MVFLFIYGDINVYNYMHGPPFLYNILGLKDCILYHLYDAHDKLF